MTSTKYAPPWLDLATGQTYGPETAATYARHVARYRDWAYHKPKPERSEAPLVHRFFVACWEELPASEVLVYRLVYVLRMSLNEAADGEGLSKSSVKSYVRRLRRRAEAWEGQGW